MVYPPVGPLILLTEPVFIENAQASLARRRLLERRSLRQGRNGDDLGDRTGVFSGVVGGYRDGFGSMCSHILYCVVTFTESQTKKFRIRAA